MKFYNYLIIFFLFMDVHLIINQEFGKMKMSLKMRIKSDEEFVNLNEIFSK